MKNVKVIYPDNFGILQKKLSSNEMIYLWNLIKNRKESVKSYLAGIIHESNKLIDTNNWFYENTLLSLIDLYEDQFHCMHDEFRDYDYYLESLWVNFQNKNEFNPIHFHNGVYSFVIWMQIPTRHNEQNKNPLAGKSTDDKVISAVEILYNDILGNIRQFRYSMDPEIEGTMIFFPSKLRHQVYPFYDCNEQRISISGNIFIKPGEL